MVEVLSFPSFGQFYPELLDNLKRAPVVGPRGRATRERSPALLALSRSRQCVVDREGFSRKMMDLEIDMLLAGVFDEELMRSVSPNAADLLAPATAYGPRVEGQLERVIRELTRDPLSRRAVVYVGTREDLPSVQDEDPAVKGEMPCTECFQLLIRDAALDMAVSMRSWDAVWGASYDVPCFVAVQMAVATALGVAPGTYTHFAGSLHLYERHWDVQAGRSVELLDIPYLMEDFAETKALARRAVQDLRDATFGSAVS